MYDVVVCSCHKEIEIKFMASYTYLIIYYTYIWILLTSNLINNT